MEVRAAEAGGSPEVTEAGLLELEAAEAITDVSLVVAEALAGVSPVVSPTVAAVTGGSSVVLKQAGPRWGCSCSVQEPLMVGGSPIPNAEYSERLPKNDANCDPVVKVVKVK